MFGFIKRAVAAAREAAAHGASEPAPGPRPVTAEAARPAATPTVDAFPTWDANVSTAVGQVDTSFDNSTAMKTVSDLTGEDAPLWVLPDGRGGWEVQHRQEAGPLTSTTNARVDENSSEVSHRNEVDAGLVTLNQGVAVGHTGINARLSADDDTLSYDMARILGVGDVDVVGLQDKLALNSGFSTTDSAPISLAHDWEVETGHDAYHFRSARGENTDEARDEALAGALADVDGVTDLTTDALANMEIGSGFAFVDDLTQQSNTEVTGRRRLGPLHGSLTVGFGSGDRDLQQTMLARTDENTVTVSLTQANSDLSSSSVGLGLGRRTTDDAPGAFQVDLGLGASVEDQGLTQVEFDIDVSDDNGRRQLDAFLNTGILPGAANVDAQDEAHQAQLDEHRILSRELGEVEPGSADYHDIQQRLFEVSGELNGEFIQRRAFRDGMEDVGQGASYQNWRTVQEQTVEHSGSFWAWKMSQVSSVQREWDAYALGDGAFDLEAGFFEDTRFTEGNALVVASPNSAPELALGTNSRADFGTIQKMYEEGLIPEGMLDPHLAQAVFEDGLGDFKHGGAQISTGLNHDQLDLLAEHGGDPQELLRGLPNFDHYTQGRHGDVEASLSEMMMDASQENFEGPYSPDDVEAFIREHSPDGELAFNASSYRESIENTTMRDFEDMKPIEREMFVETRVTDLVVNNRNPWEILSLVDAVDNEEERIHLMREVFEKIEETNIDLTSDYGMYSTGGVLGGDGANTASALLLMHMSGVAADLDPEQAEFLMSGARVDLVDRRASEWSNERILEPLAQGQDSSVVLDGLISEHIDSEGNLDKLSDNFQAVAMAGGPAMVSELVEKLGEERLVEILGETASEDPRRLALYGVALQGTGYEGVVEELRQGS